MSQAEPILELECGTGEGPAVPDGDYGAEFVRLDRHEGKPEYGPGVRWVFRISGGQYDGVEVGRIGPVRPTPKNASGVILGGMLGRDVGKENVSIKPLIGRKYKVIVHKGRVELVLPLPR
jgi:hypothetical protein